MGKAGSRKCWTVECGREETSSVQKTRGRLPPPFNGRASYRFLPPFFAPPAFFLAVFFAMLYPPLRRGFAMSLHRMCSAAAYRRAGLRLSALSRLCAATPDRPRKVARNKKGVSSSDTPGPAGGSSASSRPFSRRPFSQSSSPLFLLGTWQLSLLPVTEGYNRWAEHSTLIQDVDYG
jgi:hypothetical protein